MKQISKLPIIVFIAVILYYLFLGFNWIYNTASKMEYKNIDDSNLVFSKILDKNVYPSQYIILESKDTIGGMAFLDSCTLFKYYRLGKVMGFSKNNVFKTNHYLNAMNTYLASNYQILASPNNYQSILEIYTLKRIPNSTIHSINIYIGKGNELIMNRKIDSTTMCSFLISSDTIQIGLNQTRKFDFFLVGQKQKIRLDFKIFDGYIYLIFYFKNKLCNA